MSDLKTQAIRYIEWLQQDALPFWRRVALDPSGGFYEKISKDGRPITDCTRRTRILSRQAYAYAHASELGLDPEGKSASDHAIAAFAGSATKGDPLSGEGFDGSVHRLSADGTVANPLRDTYDLAFAILAGAHRHSAFGEAESLALSGNVFAFLDENMGQADGSYGESRPPVLPRRQNPHMHLFEASMALANTSGDASDRTRCHILFQLFKDHFYDAEYGVIREFFNDDWTPFQERWALIEPGHMAEWCWLLDQYTRLCDVETSTEMDTLFANAGRLGLNKDLGLLADVVTLGGPFPEKPTHRTWAQTEYLKAHLALIQRGNKDLKAPAAKLMERIFTHYIDPAIRGGYVDQVDGAGHQLSEHMTTSTLYHLVSAGAELQSYLNSSP